MSDDNAWQWAYYGRRTPGNLTPAPTRPRSDAMTAWQEEQARAGRLEADRMRGELQAVRKKYEDVEPQRPRSEALRDLVAQFGIETVEAVLHTSLPDEIAGRNARTPKERKVRRRHAD